jgi:hypothetical protein
VIDSFTLSFQSTLTGITFGAWSFPGHPPLTVTWIIDWSGGWPNERGGVAAVTNSTICLAGDNSYAACSGTALGFQSDLYESSFALPNITLAPGAYTLTLLGATALGSGCTRGWGCEVGWDVNNGPSTAGEWLIGAIPSESFQITGTAPEPASLTVVVGGLVLLASRKRRREQAHAERESQAGGRTATARTGGAPPAHH